MQGRRRLDDCLAMRIASSVLLILFREAGAWLSILEPVRLYIDVGAPRIDEYRSRMTNIAHKHLVWIRICWGESSPPRDLCNFVDAPVAPKEL